MPTIPYKHIVVIGTTSSGKSTLAKQIADRLHMDFIELDAFHWEPDWQEASLEDFRARVESAIQAERWVDYSLWIIFWRLWNRTWRRWWYQEELWNGNRERLRWHFKLWSQESLFHWLFKTYWRRKREFPKLMALPQHRHLKLIRFSHPRETEEWLEKLDKKRILDRPK
jgi:adenylate kinase family enzyme